MSPMSTNTARRRHRGAPRYVGLTLVIPDGVAFEDWLTGETVVRKRTERMMHPRSRSLTPA